MTAVNAYEPGPEQRVDTPRVGVGPQSPMDDEERLARIALMRIFEPADERVGRLLEVHDARHVVAQVRNGQLAHPGGASRARDIDPVGDLHRGRQTGAHFVIPGDAEWPTAFDDLKERRPYGLWLHGVADLAGSCRRSVAIVGARAATAYGVHVAAYLASGLSDSDWAVIAGGAYGIDGAAHRGALTGPSPTAVVLPCGIDIVYPPAHEHLFDAVRRQGVLISEYPPGVHPVKSRFLARNRIIAALAQGVIVVEAVLHSGSLNAAQHAYTIGRPIGAVPGPVTSELSRGPHELIRQGRAMCVESTADVLELLNDAPETAPDGEPGEA